MAGVPARGQTSGERINAAEEIAIKDRLLTQMQQRLKVGFETSVCSYGIVRVEWFGGFRRAWTQVRVGIGIIALGFSFVYRSSKEGSIVSRARSCPVQMRLHRVRVLMSSSVSIEHYFEAGNLSK